MGSLDAQTWQAYAHAYAFGGNSLLKPMSQTEPVGLDPAFWEMFPNFADESVAKAQAKLVLYAASCAESESAVQDVSVEFTHLFVGPPKPAAPPWETMYASGNATVGFGQATFDMRALLREAGLEVKNENNQYEDHLGIELLYLSTLCARVAAGEDRDTERIASFIDKHPLAWIDAFHARIAEARPGGYFDGLVALVWAVLARHRAQLSE